MQLLDAKKQISMKVMERQNSLEVERLNILVRGLITCGRVEYYKDPTLKSLTLRREVLVSLCLRMRECEGQKTISFIHKLTLVRHWTCLCRKLY